MKFKINTFNKYEKSLKKEWLLTNKLGGYASTSITGANTRRYHGLLIISKKPPVDRHLVFSKLDESLIYKNSKKDIYVYKAGNDIKRGFEYLREVDVSDTITYEYIVGNVYIKKNIKLFEYENRVLVSYVIKNKGKDFIFNITPLFNSRYFHYINRKDNIHVNNYSQNDNEITFDINDIGNIHLKYNNIQISRCENDNFFYNMEYDIEKYRGLDYIEDHYIPCELNTKIKENEEKKFSIEVFVEGDDYKYLKEYEFQNKKDGLILSRLRKAAQDFVVYRKATDSKTILAGYPWFNDWGRDAMIALPGLLLSTKRYDVAKEVLLTFGEYIKKGLVPNMLPDNDGEPLYNTVDASLWFIDSAYKYYKHTKDKVFLDNFLIDKMEEIVLNYKDGTDFNIIMDSDGLITSGSKETQLTWMDAKIGDYIVTPRHGKAIEINALWYNALKIMYELTGNEMYKDLSNITFKSFNEKFVDEKYIYDLVDSGIDKKKSKQFRPNFLYSIGSEYPVLEKKYWKRYLDMAIDDLYTPYGIRSLSYKDSEYKGNYRNDQFSRDSSYHQGTVWAYLIGIFIDAYLKVYPDKKMAYKFITPLIDSMDDGCIGSISEIFEGDFPHNHKGCFAQAWSVGELIRVYTKLRG